MMRQKHFEEIMDELELAIEEVKQGKPVLTTLEIIKQKLENQQTKREA